MLTVTQAESGMDITENSGHETAAQTSNQSSKQNGTDEETTRGYPKGSDREKLENEPQVDKGAAENPPSGSLTRKLQCGGSNLLLNAIP